MGKKRKSNSHASAKDLKESEEQTKYKVNEEFADSEDEFFRQRDRILLDDGPSNKRRKVQEDGRKIQGCNRLFVTKLKGFQMHSYSPRTKKS